MNKIDITTCRGCGRPHSEPVDKKYLSCCPDSNMHLEIISENLRFHQQLLFSNSVRMSDKITGSSQSINEHMILCMSQLAVK